MTSGAKAFVVQRVAARRIAWTLVFLCALAAPWLCSAQSVPQSKTDLWDISQGTVITASSGANYPYSDLRDMFGGEFSPIEPGNAVFDNNKPAGFVHYVEWQTPAPVTVGAFSLFAAGDGPQFFNEREFSKFVLKAKSSADAPNFDVVLYELDVTNHPYTWLDASTFALISTNITPITAQYFRAEFTQYTAGRGFDSPRIVELDAYPKAAPTIVTEPADQTVTAGSDATFMVEALGVGPLKYRWFVDGFQLLDATNASLTVTNVGLHHSERRYSVTVENKFGLAVSRVARLRVLPPPPVFRPSTNDLWDISQGTVITGSSGANVPYSDLRDMFGGEFSPIEPGNTVFDNNKPAGFVHYIEWETPREVTVDSFALFAAGDGPQFLNEREFSKFVLKAKSCAEASNYDVTMYTLDVTNHPYTFVDSNNYALVVTNIRPVTSRYFRAEFTQYTAGRGFDSPRIIELDGFGRRDRDDRRPEPGRILNPPPGAQPLPPAPPVPGHGTYPPSSGPLPPRPAGPPVTILPILPPTLTSDVPAVSMSIRTGNGNVIVTWPVTAANCVLQGAADPHSDIWQVIGISPVTNGTSVSVTIPLSEAPQFFRLYAP